MAYVVTVIRGPDEGRHFKIEAGENVIGRSPSSQIVLRDESVAWEHASVRAENSKVILRNLSALGTTYRGRRVNGEVQLHAGDEITLSDECTIAIRQRAGTVSAARIPSPVLVVGAITILGLLVVAGSLLFGSSEPTKQPLKPTHWRQAYHLLDERLATWTRNGWFPHEARAMFQDAWRLELAANSREAAVKWDTLRSSLLAMPVPGGMVGGPTMAEVAGNSSKSLQVVMGYDLRARSTDFAWESDQTYTEALVWFVRYRAQLTREKAGGSK